jgi:hypothetical protein
MRLIFEYRTTAEAMSGFSLAAHHPVLRTRVVRSYQEPVLICQKGGGAQAQVLKAKHELAEAIALITQRQSDRGHNGAFSEIESSA